MDHENIFLKNRTGYLNISKENKNTKERDIT